jgi:hypothetical protein
MKSKIAIYLAGSIQKGHELHESYWSHNEMEILRNHLPDYLISFLNPAFRSDDLSDQHSVFGRDMLQVYCSNIVFVDARNRRGLGVGAEMMWAKFNSIPVITLAPKNTHYHKAETSLLGVPVDNWIHPFVESLTDKIVETLEEGAECINQIFNNPSFKIKDINHVHDAMRHYQQHQLDNDLPMLDLISTNSELYARVTRPMSDAS